MNQHPVGNYGHECFGDVQLQRRLQSNAVISADTNKNYYKNFQMSYHYFGQPVWSLHTPDRNWCKVHFVDVSRTWKSYARHKQLHGLFESTLRRLPSYASDFRGFICFRDQHH